MNIWTPTKLYNITNKIALLGFWVADLKRRALWKHILSSITKSNASCESFKTVPPMAQGLRRAGGRHSKCWRDFPKSRRQFWMTSSYSTRCEEVISIHWNLKGNRYDFFRPHCVRWWHGGDQVQFMFIYGTVATGKGLTKQYDAAAILQENGNTAVFTQVRTWPMLESWIKGFGQVVNSATMTWLESAHTV